jgi:hypothetical protein
MGAGSANEDYLNIQVRPQIFSLLRQQESQAENSRYAKQQ